MGSHRSGLPFAIFVSNGGLGWQNSHGKRRSATFPARPAYIQLISSRQPRAISVLPLPGRRKLVDGMAAAYLDRDRTTDVKLLRARKGEAAGGSAAPIRCPHSSVTCPVVLKGI